VKQIAHLRGLKKVGTPPPWSKREEALLRKMYPDNNMREIADKIGRSISAVTGRAHKLGISEPKRIWSKKELNLLRKLYPTKTAEQLADRMGRTVLATRLRIVKMGLRKRKRKGKM
jgi:hypothetical protein